MKIETKELERSLDTLAELFPTTRFAKQQKLERTIAEFSPDAVEAYELLHALIRGLKNRYDEDLLVDVLQEAAQFEDALHELDRTNG